MFFGKSKDHKCTIVSTGETFTVPAKMNLLQAALNAGIKWPHDCRVGSCGTCRCILKEGKVKAISDFAYVLDGEMLKQGYILGCQAQLKSDIEVEVDFDQGAVENLKMT